MQLHFGGPKSVLGKILVAKVLHMGIGSEHFVQFLAEPATAQPVNEVHYPGFMHYCLVKIVGCSGELYGQDFSGVQFLRVVNQFIGV